MAISVDAMFISATAAFAFGLSLATYRWFARHNGWPMGAWQTGLASLPRTVGLVLMMVAMAFAFRRGLGTILLLPLIGLLGAIAWTLVLKVGGQSALLLGPISAALVIVGWWLGSA